MKKSNHIKAIAIDLDGTLVGSTHHVSIENKKTVQLAAESGIHIIIASGRPLAGILAIADEISLREVGGYIIGANGACVVDMNTGEKIVDKLISKQEAKELIQYVKGINRVTILSYDDKSMLIEDLNHPRAIEIAKGLLIPIKKVDNLEEMKSLANKFILTGEEEDLKKAYPVLKTLFKGKLECIYGGGNFIEVMPPFVSKAEGLKLLMNRLQLSADNLMCIGDSANDILMFEYAGVTVAMENACEEIKTRACYMTSSCDNAGVAKAIKKLVISRI